jgi:ferredoxin
MNLAVSDPSRRAFLRRLVPVRTAQDAPVSVMAEPGSAAARPPAEAPSPVAPLAVIAGRFCLAYQRSFCSVCREHCPVPGAVIVERGLPRIVPELCNGCRLCHEACPAPVNAIRLVPRPPALPVRPVATPLPAESARHVR